MIPWLLWIIVSAGSLLATFGRDHSIQMCRRFASDMKLPMTPHDHDGIQRAAMLIRARLILEQPSAFTIVELDDTLTLFACVPSERACHRIDAIVWGDEQYVRHFRALRTWHRSQYPEFRLTVGRLEKEELVAWQL